METGPGDKSAETEQVAVQATQWEHSALHVSIDSQLDEDLGGSEKGPLWWLISKGLEAEALRV